MEQSPLFQDLAPPHLMAAKRDVDAIADNYKDAARLIWPNEDPLNGQKKLSNALSGGQKQKLDLHEYAAIARAAALKAGKSYITEYFTAKQPCEVKWVAPEVLVERIQFRAAEIMQQWQKTLAEGVELLEALNKVRK